MRYFTMYLVQQVRITGAVLLTFLFYIWHELRDKRKREGLSIESAAEICGVDPSTYARWERRMQYPHPRNLTVLMEKINPYDEVWFAENSYVPNEWLPPRAPVKKSNSVLKFCRKEWGTSQDVQIVDHSTPTQIEEILA